MYARRVVVAIKKVWGNHVRSEGRQKACGKKCKIRSCRRFFPANGHFVWGVSKRHAGGGGGDGGNGEDKVLRRSLRGD
jgi:hypothetical protein